MQRCRLIVGKGNGYANILLFSRLIQRRVPTIVTYIHLYMLAYFLTSKLYTPYFAWFCLLCLAHNLYFLKKIKWWIPSSYRHTIQIVHFPAKIVMSFMNNDKERAKPTFCARPRESSNRHCLLNYIAVTILYICLIIVFFCSYSYIRKTFLLHHETIQIRIVIITGAHFST